MAGARKKTWALGADIEDIERFGKLERKKDAALLKKIFTARELTYCFSKKNPAQHLAARFCGKEAAIKALFDIGRPGAVFHDIEILNLQDGRPRVLLNERKLRGYSVRVSLSHSGACALALVLALKNNLSLSMMRPHRRQ